MNKACLCPKVPFCLSVFILKINRFWVLTCFLMLLTFSISLQFLKFLTSPVRVCLVFIKCLSFAQPKVRAKLFSIASCPAKVFWKIVFQYCGHKGKWVFDFYLIFIDLLFFAKYKIHILRQGNYFFKARPSSRLLSYCLDMLRNYTMMKIVLFFFP